MGRRLFSLDQVGREAWNSIRGQRWRCGNANASDYKYYGAKGIKVTYTSKEFVVWFKKHRAKIPLNIKVNVDRIDHDKNYCFSNIKLIPKVDNVAEANSRTKPKPVIAYDLDTMTPLAYFKSAIECADILKTTRSTISRHCTREIDKSCYRNGLIYRFNLAV